LISHSINLDISVAITPQKLLLQALRLPVQAQNLIVLALLITRRERAAKEKETATLSLTPDDVTFNFLFLFMKNEKKQQSHKNVG